jgi:hypothetical protein
MGAGSSSSVDFIKQADLLRRCLDEERRDPGEFAISKRVYIAIDNDRARAERRLRDWFGMRYKNAEMASRVPSGAIPQNAPTSLENSCARARNISC